MKSKIIQIAATTKKGDGAPYLYALCEDGSVWRKYGLEGEWLSVSKPFQADENTMHLPISGGE